MSVRLCPVCRGVVWKSEGGNIVRHRDKANQPCPTSGYPFRITDPLNMEVAS